MRGSSRAVVPGLGLALLGPLLGRGASAEPEPAAQESADVAPGEPEAVVELRRELDAARAHLAAGEHAACRQRCAAAIDAALALTRARPDDREPFELCGELGHLARLSGDLAAAERAWSARAEGLARLLPGDDPKLQSARQDLAVLLQGRGDLAGARALLEQVLASRERLLPSEHPDLLRTQQNLAMIAYSEGDLSGAEETLRRVLAVAEKSLPADDTDLVRVRQNLAVTLQKRGDLAGALALFSSVLESRERTLPEGDPELLAARMNLAAALSWSGELAPARALLRQVLEARERSLPADHPDLQRSRLNLAIVEKQLGDLPAALALERAAVDARERTLPADHRDLLLARLNLASTLQQVGEYADAREMLELVVRGMERNLPEDHPDLLAARTSLAATLHRLRDLGAARALYESVLLARTRSLPPEHPSLVEAQGNLGATLGELGDLAGARALDEQVLRSRERTLSEDHPDLTAARVNLAGTLAALGDLPGARALQERVLQSLERTLPDVHPHILSARLSLASTLYRMHDQHGAHALFESVLAARESTLEEGHPDLDRARRNVAATRQSLGDPEGARVLLERVLASLLARLPADHRDVLDLRLNLAMSLRARGDLEGARAHAEEVLALRERTLTEDDPELLTARLDLAITLACQALAARAEPAWNEPAAAEARGRCEALVLAVLRAERRAARSVLLGASAREAEERLTAERTHLSLALSFAQGYGAFEPFPELLEEAFVLSEATRGAALASRRLAAATEGLEATESSEEHARLLGELRAASAELADAARRGAPREEFHRARERREEAERALLAAARERGDQGLAALELGLEPLAAHLSEGEALVAFRRYTHSRAELVDDGARPGGSRVEGRTGERIGAFVLAKPRAGDDARLAFADLGPLDALEEAARAWRASLGVGSAAEPRPDGTGAPARGIGLDVLPADASAAEGRALRRLAWDPLLGALHGARRVMLAPDDVLHLVPFDALPLDEDDRLLGERVRVETRVALWELLEPPRSTPPDGLLVALGGASFDSPPELPDEAALAPRPLLAAAAIQGALESASFLRGAAWEAAFAPLAATAPEARAIAALRASLAGDDGALVLEGPAASRAALEALAPHARFLHVATHGWFAPDSVRAWGDVDPLADGLAQAASSAEVVRGMSPMLLCGLALAGANLPADGLGRAPGLITAEELSTFDLTACELAVLSACDTNVGERRAGQGVASLQKALHMAGARSVITSLWKVPDEATRELMLDFYRRLWVEGKPKHQALWEAKLRLRDERTERGERSYAQRDWAAWVLTGEP